MSHFFDALWWWIEVHTGTVNEPGPYYGFWSGFGSDLGEYTIAGGIVTGLVQTYRRNKCQSCPRLVLKHGKGQVDGTHFDTCRVHANSEHHAMLFEHHRLHYPGLHRHLNKGAPNDGNNGPSIVSGART
jgi:hypothetical protein